MIEEGEGDLGAFTHLLIGIAATETLPLVEKGVATPVVVEREF